MPRTYLALVHQDDADGPFGVSFPELPGCVGLGDTLEDALTSGREALAFHLDGEPEPELPAGGAFRVDDLRDGLVAVAQLTPG